MVSASAAERNWSIYGQIKSERRTGLDHTKSDKLVYCHEALHLKEKSCRRTASYKTKVAKWDSDSDSDESDDEERPQAVMVGRSKAGGVAGAGRGSGGAHTQG